MAQRPKRSDLVPLDPTKLRIIALADDGPVEVNRGAQRGVLVVTLEELTRALGLPADHRIERIQVSGDEFAPELLVSVEGPAMTLYTPGLPLKAEPFAGVMAEIDERRKDMADFWLFDAVKLRTGFR